MIEARQLSYTKTLYLIGYTILLSSLVNLIFDAERLTRYFETSNFVKKDFMLNHSFLRQPHFVSEYIPMKGIVKVAVRSNATK